MSKLYTSLAALLIAFSISINLSAQTQTLRLKPLTSSDDAEQNTTTGTVQINSTDLELGGYDWDGKYKQSTGIRFPNVTLPQGATISKAYIQFSVDELYAAGNTANITIKAQKGNAATYAATANNISSRTYTTANVTWATAAWTVLNQRLAAQQTPDLKALITEAMQTGFVSGNALAFCFTTTSNGYAAVYSKDRSTTNAPELVIEYTTAPPLSISADKTSGTYSTPFNVALTGTTGATIRYTTDGSTPTATTGTVYSAPIAVTKSTTIKAISVLNNNTSSVLTLNYVFPLCSATSNLALNKTTSQSSLAFGGDSQRAVDGNTSGIYNDNSITHTNTDANSWWQVDLGQVSNIDVVTIFNRTDCCSDRLSNFYVFVSETPFSSTSLATTLSQTTTVKSYFFTGQAPIQTTIPFNTKGRYVRIQLKDQNYLSLAEVQVMGCDIPVPRTQLSNVFINEVSGSGTATVKNDWIELYNNNDFIVSLDSVFLTDAKGNLSKFMFKGRNLPAKGFIVVETDDTLTAPTSTKAAFGISAKGETIYLYQTFNGVQSLLDTVAVPASIFNESYGRKTDGNATFIKIGNPSPALTNNNSTVLLEPIVASHQRGIYESAFTLTLTAPTGATIYYTTNGTVPSATNGSVYSTPLSISSSMALRAVAISAIGKSRVMTQTYVFPTSVASKIALPTADVSKALKELPIAVINSAGDFNNTTSEFACSFEYINKFGENKSVQSDGGFGAFGNVSLTLPKKNYRVKFSTAYGVKNLKYKIFERSADENYDPIDDIGGLDFRAGHDATGADISGMMMSDYLMRKLMNKLGSKDVHVRFVHLFFNGQYHGVYAVREHFTPEYVETYYGGNEDTAELVKGEDVGLQWGPRIVQQGTGALWDAIKADSDNKNFQGLKAKMDVPHFINFMMVFLLGGQETEFKAVTNMGYKPKMVVYFKDVDAFMNGSGRGATNYKTYNLAYNGQGPGNLMAMTGIAGGTVNREYQTMAKDRIWLAMIQPKGVLRADSLNALVTQASNILTPVMAIDYARWQNISPSYFASQVSKIKTDMPTKVNDVMNYYKTYNLIHTLNPVTFSKASGSLNIGEKIFITNPNAGTTVYYTTDGTDVVFDNGISPTAKLYDATKGIDLPLGKTKIRARAYTTNNFGMYADAEYVVSRPIKITAIAYQPNPAAPAAEPKGSDVYEFFNLTNTGTTAIDISNFMVTEAIDTFRLPVGTSIAGGETIMLCSDDTKYPSVTLRKFKWIKGKLANEGENISFRDNLGNLVNEVKYDTLAPWPYAKGNGSYIRLKNSSLDNKIGSNWEAVSLTPLLTTGTLNLQNKLIFTAEGHQEGSKAIINWVSNANKNVDYFIVEKMDKDKTWFEKLEIVNAQYSNQDNALQYYAITDETPKKDVVQYRVGMILNGQATPLQGSTNVQYLEPITLDFSQFVDYAIYPNPATESITIDLSNVVNKETAVSITDLMGKIIVQKHFDNAPNSINMDLNKIMPGQYFIHIQTKDKKVVTKSIIISQ